MRSDPQVLGVDAAREVVPPRQKRVYPGRDRVAIPAHVTDGERATPAVVPERAHRRLVPLLFVVPPVQDRAVDAVVAIGETVGLDVDRFADDALDRKAAPFDGGSDVFDDGPDATVGRKFLRRSRMSRTHRVNDLRA